MSQPRIVQENVRPAGAALQSFARGTGQAIPSVLSSPSHIELVPRNDGTDRVWRNEVGNLILKDPNSERVYAQYGVVLNWHVERTETVPGLDADPTTGEILTVEDLKNRVIEFVKAQSIGSADVSTETAGAVLED